MNVSVPVAGLVAVVGRNATDTEHEALTARVVPQLRLVIRNSPVEVMELMVRADEPVFLSVTV